MKNKYIYLIIISLYFACCALSAMVIAGYESQYAAGPDGSSPNLTIAEQTAFFMFRYVLQFPIWIPNWFQESKEGFALLFFLPNSIIIAKLIIAIKSFKNRRRSS